MDPITIAALISAGGSLASGLINFFGQSKAQQIIAEARAKYGTLDANSVYQTATKLLGPSAFESLKTDPRYREAQNAALAKMQGIVEGGGLDATDKANLNRVEGEAARADSANRQSILEGEQARGELGSGGQLAALLQSGQGAATRTNQGALDTASAARQRYFEALQQEAAMASGMRSQDFGEQSTVAQAKDARDIYNRGAAIDAEQQRFNNEKAAIDGQNGLATTQAQLDMTGAKNAAGAVQSGANAAAAYEVYGGQPKKKPDPNDPYGDGS